MAGQSTDEVRNGGRGTAARPLPAASPSESRGAWSWGPYARSPERSAQNVGALGLQSAIRIRACDGSRDTPRRCRVSWRVWSSRHLRPRQRDAPERRQIHSRIDHGAIEMAMPQHIGDLLERRAPAGHTRGGGVAKRVSPLRRDCETGPLKGSTDLLSSRIARQRPPDRQPVGHKEVPTRRRRSPPTKVFGHRLPNLLRKRKDRGTTGLAGAKVHGASPPVHIVQSEGHDLAHAQRQLPEAERHRVIATAGCRRAVEGPQQPADLRVSQVTGHGVSSAGHGGHGRDQIGAAVTLLHQIADECADCCRCRFGGHRMALCCAIGDEGPHALAPQSLSGRNVVG